MFNKLLSRLIFALQVATLFMQFVLFGTGVVGTVTVLILLFTRYYFISLLYLAWFIYDEFWSQSSIKGGRCLPRFRSYRIWRLMADYFPIRLHKIVDLDPSENYLFAAHPHGHFGHGYICSFATDGADFNKLFPGLTCHPLTVNAFFKWPVLRELILMLGGGSVSKDSIEYRLKLGPGHSVYVTVGGAEEMFLSGADDYYLNILRRKGFIRVALQTGASVVPVFLFGEHRQFLLSEWKEGSFGYWFAVVAEKIWGVRLPNIIGKWSLLWGAMPFGKPINHLVGAPLKFDKEELAKTFKTEYEMIDACHQIYLDALRKLFEENKARFGEGDRKLIYT